MLLPVLTTIQQAMANTPCIEFNVDVLKPFRTSKVEVSLVIS